jgi:FkbM family methyltransferase
MSSSATSARDPQARLGGVRAVTNSWHSAIASSPRLSKAYLRAVSALCRHVLPEYLTARVENLVAHPSVRWPVLDLAPRSVVVGERTRVRLVPHLGEFCQSALFRRRMTYEREVFVWLEQAAQRYDAAIEIGANVGIYSVLFDALIKARPGARLRKVFCFEPSLEAFVRLIENLRVNGASHVVPYRAAVGDARGFRTFFEPRGHLTNGSFVEGFARQFSDKVAKSIVAVHHADDLGPLFEGHRKVLLKIDVEGYEPQLLGALELLIEQFRPDILLEVLPGSAEPLNGIVTLSHYEKSLITTGGLRRETALRAEERYRDWLLTAPEAPAMNEPISA